MYLKEGLAIYASLHNLHMIQNTSQFNISKHSISQVATISLQGANRHSTELVLGKLQILNDLNS